jgi:hypothetical protein
VGCIYFKDAKPKRTYREIPRFSTEEMERDSDLQSIAFVIEGEICAWDHSLNDTLKDEAAIRALELLLDKYFFHDESVATTDETIRAGFDRVSNVIDTALGDIPPDILVKILGVIRFVARRRSRMNRGSREYLTVIRKYVGVNIAPGIRVLS